MTHCFYFYYLLSSMSIIFGISKKSLGKLDVYLEGLPYLIKLLDPITWETDEGTL